MRRCFPRTIQSLDPVFRFIADAYLEAGIDDVRRVDTQLIVEELFTNMVRHNRGGSQEIAILLERAGSELRIELTDFAVDPFDPADAPAPNTQVPPEQRRPGGLGLHLVRKLAEKMEYRYENGNSTIIVHQHVGE